MKIKLRDMKFATASVDDVKHVAIVPEVQHALIRWIKSKVGPVAPGVLIGGLAMSFYAKPRYTEYADLLFITEDAIPKSVSGFRRHRPGAFEDTATNVEIEVVTCKSIHIPDSIAHRVYDTAIVHDGLRVASLEAMIVLKLYGADTRRREHQDLGDVVRMLEVNGDVDLSDWNLSGLHKERFKDALERAKE